jgi:hypothetical protein
MLKGKSGGFWLIFLSRKIDEEIWRGGGNNLGSFLFS